MIDDIARLRSLLINTRSIAVVGLSANTHRPSYFAAKYMQEHGYKIIPVNPSYKEILGERCFASLSDIPVQVDMVDVFRKPEDVLPLVDEAHAIGAKSLWLQLGVINQQAVERAEALGLDLVMDRCVKIEYARIFGGLNWFGVNTGIISAKKPILPGPQ